MTRWKLTIGALGLGLGGLAAVAAGPGQGGVSCRPHTVKKEPPVAPPVDVPAPKPSDLPVVPVAAAPTPRSIPAAEPLMLPGTPPPAAHPLIANGTFTPGVRPPQPVSGPAKPDVPVGPPLLPQVAGGPVVPSYPDLPPPSGVLKPTMAKTDVGDLVPLPVAPPGLPASFPESLPPAGDKPSDPARIPVMPLPEPARPAPTAAVEPAKPTPAAPAPVVADKKLKVMLHMGDDRPRFEVRDGDEVYLKVTSSQVDVKAPGDGGANLSTLKAAGKVRFVTPGGEGTCDELAVVPGTGLVTVTGGVAFTTNWGKTETTVTGEKLTFRLGAPGAAGGAAPVEVARTR